MTGAIVAWNEFWRAFETSGRRELPVLFRRGEYPGLGVSIDSIFDAAVRMCDQFRSMPRSDRIGFSRIRFYIAGQRIEDPEAYLLLQHDRDFVGWHNRVKTIAPDHCIIFTHLESTFGEDIAGILEFLNPLVHQLGLPVNRSEVTLFAGQYRKTPFGIHQDPELNFYWPLIGPKRIRFWKPDHSSGKPGFARTLDYEEYVSDSLLLDATAGDMIAWPGNWWHVAEGGDTFNASLTIPLAWYPSEEAGPEQPLPRLAKLLFAVAAQRSKSTLLPTRANEDTSEAIPDIIPDAARLFGGIRPDDIADFLTEQWLRQITTAGLPISLPSRNNSAIDDSQRVRCTNGEPIRWARLSRGKVCIASRGRSVVLPYSAAMVEVVRELNTLQPHSVRSLTEHLTSKCAESSPGAVTKFALMMLAKIGAVEAC
jgi:hypothetical protein